ncbi:ribonucleoside triphosphate reductase [Candidatus Micrarchaeota archaeon]|nr:ribonucleoside triphosphate reductase [Candidatus Micrarchaeota archaeon]
MTDVDAWVEGYLNKTSWIVRENSNVAYSFSGLFLRMGGNVIEKYVLDRVYPKRISKAHINGNLHIHNLPFGLVGYCAGWSLRQLLMEGFNGVEGRVESAPAKHFDTALMQSVNFLGTLQNEWAGAMAFNSVDTFLAPFIAKDRLSYKRVKQDIQKFIFNLNVTSRWGGQTLFTNVTLDIIPPHDLKQEPVIVGGKTQKDTYQDFQDEIDMFNRAFLEVMLEGDMRGRPFSFPIPTYNITKEFDWNSDIADLIFKVTAKYGLPYFSNFVNSDMDPSDIRSMCCHLRLDLRELRRNVTGGLFGSGEMTGSVGVVTINMPRLGYLSRDESEFFDRLDELLEIAKDSLEIKRKLVQKNMDNGLIPYSKRYLGTLKFHFSTIGLVGMNEACLNLFGEDISTKHGKRFAEKVLKYIRRRLSDFQEETGNLYNLEATPAEGSSYRLALIDKKKYPKIITASEKVPRYTNSTWLPVDKTDDVIYAMRHQESLQTLYTGGTVFHAFIGERCDPDSCKAFVKKVMFNTRLPYITITPTYSVCPKHGYFAGEQHECPICHGRTEVYSRVVGYFKPVSNWNPGKQQEFKERKTYDVV